MLQHPNILSQIEKNYLSMSSVEKKIGDYILHFPDNVVHMTMRILAKEAGVSEGSIVNFLNKFEMDGFTALKINIAQSIGSHEHLVFNDIGDTDSPKDAMKKLIDNAISSFHSTYRAIQTEELEKAANLIIDAKRVEFYGVVSSALPATDAYYRFMHLGMHTAVVTDPWMCPISASMLDENCLAVAISHTGRTEEIIKTMKIAKNQGAKSLCITSYSGSTLAKLCDVSLIAVSKETAINSLPVACRLTHFLLLDTLCAYVSAKQKERSMARQMQINEIIDHDNHY
ncbi:MAG: MurR/RpiR family transcriptional regulator [Oscillospiraceae bacterium]